MHSFHNFLSPSRIFRVTGTSWNLHFCMHFIHFLKCSFHLFKKTFNTTAIFHPSIHLIFRVLLKSNFYSYLHSDSSSSKTTSLSYLCFDEHTPLSLLFSSYKFWYIFLSQSHSLPLTQFFMQFLHFLSPAALTWSFNHLISTFFLQILTKSHNASILLTVSCFSCHIFAWYQWLHPSLLSYFQDILLLGFSTSQPWFFQQNSSLLFF